MVEIIPALLTRDEKEFRRKVEAVTDLCQTIQIDVMDDTFVPGHTFADPGRIDSKIMPPEYEIHLMVADPFAQLDAWSLAGCTRAIIHAETVPDAKEALKQVRLYGMEPGLAINPDTPLDQNILDAMPEAAVVQIMGVTPGDMGRPFQRVALEKVRELRRLFPELIIAVDGGVAVGTARELAEAGADRLVVGSAIFNNGAPAKAIGAIALDANPE
jgi:ribulose-phosphate 3-epimerase